ncbi:hypothetical protein JHK85_017181 [Glycine max]|uniref:Ubiquitin carboxyl-terminal hydrolase 15 n=2 Tax=Glycine subgen. Soja TaxID=1462606 RepID=A0A0R0JMK6_SOYBN|nr:hypothetical protein JHK87_016702 [Glycine soja]KAG5033199.1 hypothetical protein JHK85_017181 [Glycine max]KAG5047400.1 hypothetical protein JHK86_016806 [Glycine max]RZC09578.1 Ubiquitin carboxyl-terminal hydrolase 15 isoform A [Glycine soja]RZC09579.1 Ubiquitin carboxyl-terminal hydrolase 15 isoform B [Glycine soja]
MLEPRESDIPVLFLVLVVLPLVAYILLGKWSETTKKRDTINLLAHLAAEEALRAEEMVVADVIPPVSASKNEHHVCARCSVPARTRCSRCKIVRYWIIFLILEIGGTRELSLKLETKENASVLHIKNPWIGQLGKE